ncbi:MAG TPA: NAD-dependent epimerase/dehydratase family protein [Longimicrobium sp.]|nr:NAD-dependent epimerase/dehydratase family protein [Longimicrobium sp.]
MGTDGSEPRRVFVTGGTGYVGRAVADAFRRAGHAVTVMVRGDAAADRLRAAGFAAVVADLRRPETYRAHAAAHDVVAHAAFEYDAAGEEVLNTEAMAVDALLAACADAGAPRQLIYTSNAFLLGGMGPDPVDEDAPVGEDRHVSSTRLRLERTVLQTSTETVRTAAVRVGSVYGGSGGTFPWLFELAGRDGWMPVWGTGENRWSLVYLRDLADMYLRIAEHRASGVFHGADGVPMTLAEIVKAAARAAGCGTRQVPARGVRDVLLRDVAVLPARARALGWAPSIPSFREGAKVAWREWRASARACPE